MKSLVRPARLILAVLGGLALLSLCQFLVTGGQHNAQAARVFETCHPAEVIIAGSRASTGTIFFNDVVTGSPSPLCRYADLEVEKTVNDPEPNEGDIVVYEVTVTNNGPLDATSVQLTDTLPTGVTYDSHAASQGTYTGGLWTIGNLVEDAKATLTITATVDSGTDGMTITNTAHGLTADQSDPDYENNEDSAVIVVGGTVTGADLSVGKVVNDPKPAPGDIITYTVTVTNNGPCNATGVQLTDVLPAGVTFVSYSATRGIYASASGLWEVGSLENTANAILTIAATVENGTSGKTITNTAYNLTADQPDPNLDNNEASVTIKLIPSRYFIYLPIISKKYEPLLCDPYFDDFSNPESGWATDDSGDVRTGYSESEEYFIDRQMAGMRIVQAPVDYSNQYTVEVDVRWGDIGYEYGLIFGQTDFPVPTYRFGVDPANQRYRLRYHNGSEWECIGQPDPCWVHSPSIKPGSNPNHLRAECDGPTISLYVDDILLWQRNVEIPSCAGQVGLFAQSISADPAAAYFDNFRVSCPSGVSSLKILESSVSSVPPASVDLGVDE